MGITGFFLNHPYSVTYKDCSEAEALVRRLLQSGFLILLFVLKAVTLLTLLNASTSHSAYSVFTPVSTETAGILRVFSTWDAASLGFLLIQNQTSDCAP